MTLNRSVSDLRNVRQNLGFALDGELANCVGIFCVYVKQKRYYSIALPQIDVLTVSSITQDLGTQHDLKFFV